MGKNKDACRCENSSQEERKTQPRSRGKHRMKYEKERLFEISIPAREAGKITRFQCCIVYDQTIRNPEVKNPAGVDVPQLVELVLPTRRFPTYKRPPKRKMSLWRRLECFCIVIVSCILLITTFVFVLFWIFVYRDGLSWFDDLENKFNYHIIFATGGYIVCSGFSLLLYQICRCCKRVYVKFLHAFLHGVSMMCAFIALSAVGDYHKEPITHFYSLHGWIGGATEFLFILQFVVGFTGFIVMLLYKEASAPFRASLVPIHSIFGITIFVLGVAACLTGLTESAFHDLGLEYQEGGSEAMLINTLAMILVSLAIILSYAARRSCLHGAAPDHNKYHYDRL